MDLLSRDLVSFDYRDRLQRDLGKAKVCRFLVAYVTLGGLNAIARPVLIQALRNEQSFGVASLTCSCGFDPLVRLQNDLSDIRLKYFMDPLIRESNEPSDLALFHSKLVYLWLERERKSIVYIGSHNWTRRALGPGGPRNAEASLRLEFDFDPEHLDGVAGTIPGDVNRHLLNAWQLPACLPADNSHVPTFEEWQAKGCRKAPTSPIQDVVIVLAIRHSSSGTPTPDDWQALNGRGIYLQALRDNEGETVWNNSERILVLVWESESDLASAQQPIILRCRSTTSKAGITSQRRGTNQATAPVAGFDAALWDEQASTNASSSRPSVQLWSSRQSHVFDFEFPTARSDSSQVDGVATPTHQFYLEVESVVFPEGSQAGDRPGLVWSRESFAVAESRESARLEESPGYFVPTDQRDAILTSLEEGLLIDAERCKVLPCSDRDPHKVGRRVSDHPLHDTFLGAEWRERSQRDAYYERTHEGHIVAELDSTDRDSEKLIAADPPLPRVVRVFTTRLDDLEEQWMESSQEPDLRKKRDSR